jgi:hypothetical protein
MVEQERDNTLIVTITRLLCAESIDRRAATYLHLQMASYDLHIFCLPHPKKGCGILLLLLFAS